MGLPVMIQLFDKKLYIGIKFMILMNALGDQKHNSRVMIFFFWLSFQFILYAYSEKMDLGPLSMSPLS